MTYAIAQFYERIVSDVRKKKKDLLDPVFLKTEQPRQGLSTNGFLSETFSEKKR